MPVNVPDNLPAIETLKQENIFVMTHTRASHQDIRPQRVLLLNIMPQKVMTESHILRQLSNTPLQVEIDLLHPKSHKPKNTPENHLKTFYKTFDQVKHQRYDGLIITGAPVEKLPFEAVDYWPELQEIMDWSINNVTSTLYICWAAQAGLYHHYGIQKFPLPRKMFGVFYHKVNTPQLPLVRGFDDYFLAPHSRHTEIRAEDIEKVDALELVSASDVAGVYIVASKDGSQVFVTGHSEYDPSTLKEEYERDLEKGKNIHIPQNYFPYDNPEMPPVVRWRSHANLLFSNWLNYYVYQRTPFDLNNAEQSAKELLL